MFPVQDVADLVKIRRVRLSKVGEIHLLRSCRWLLDVCRGVRYNRAKAGENQRTSRTNGMGHALRPVACVRFGSDWVRVFRFFELMSTVR